MVRSSCQSHIPAVIPKAFLKAHGQNETNSDPNLVLHTIPRNKKTQTALFNKIASKFDLRTLTVCAFAYRIGSQNHTFLNVSEGADFELTGGRD